MGGGADGPPTSYGTHGWNHDSHINDAWAAFFGSVVFCGFFFLSFPPASGYGDMRYPPDSRYTEIDTTSQRLNKSDSPACGD